MVNWKDITTIVLVMLAFAAVCFIAINKVIFNTNVLHYCERQGFNDYQSWSIDLMGNKETYFCISNVTSVESSMRHRELGDKKKIKDLFVIEKLEKIANPFFNNVSKINETSNENGTFESLRISAESQHKIIEALRLRIEKKNDTSTEQIAHPLSESYEVRGRGWNVSLTLPTYYYDGNWSTFEGGGCGADIAIAYYFNESHDYNYVIHDRVSHYALVPLVPSVIKNYTVEDVLISEVVIA